MLLHPALCPVHPQTCKLQLLYIMLCMLPVSISVIHICLRNSMDVFECNTSSQVGECTNSDCMQADVEKPVLHYMANLEYAFAEPHTYSPRLSHAPGSVMLPTCMPDCADTVERMMGGSSRNPYNIFLLGVGPMINASLAIAAFAGTSEKGAWGPWAKTLVESWKNNGVEVRHKVHMRRVHIYSSQPQMINKEYNGCSGYEFKQVSASTCCMSLCCTVLYCNIIPNPLDSS